MSRTIVIALALSFAAFAQTKPNFSGNWKLNIGKSDFGMLPPPDSRTDVIEQTSDLVKDTVSSVGQQGPMNYVLAVKPDGTETTVHTGERDVKVSAVWDGPALVVTTKLDYQGSPVTIKSHWTLSADAAVWTQSAHIESPMGEMDTRMVFDKDAGTATAAMPAKTTPPATSTPTATATAGAHPNFSGTWKLNVSKSDFGPIPGPDSETDIIDQTEPTINMAVDRKGPQGDQNYKLALMINGQEETHKLGDQEVKTTASWDGPALMVLTKLMFQDNEILIKSAYTLGADGKTVNVAAHFSSPMGEADQKLVYDKQ